MIHAVAYVSGVRTDEYPELGHCGAAAEGVTVTATVTDSLTAH